MDKLLVISLDTYRKDNIGKAVDGVPISPFLARIARQGIFYDNYYASCNWTVPAYASMFTGQPTVAHNFWGVKSDAEQSTNLIFDRVAAAGLRPSLLAAGVLGEADLYKCRSKNYFASTYDTRKLDGTIDLVIQRLGASDLVFFHTFLMHDYFMHFDYLSPRLGIKRQHRFIGVEESEQMGRRMKAWRDEHFSLAPDELAKVEKMYYNECLLVDDFAKALLTAVLAKYPKTRILINSDHGECFSHCGKPAFGKDWTWLLWPLWHHSSGLCYEQFEVFAIEYGAGINGGPKVDKDLMDHEDIHRIMLDRLGLATPKPCPKTFNLVSTAYGVAGYCGVLESDQIYLYDLNQDCCFLLADHIRTNVPVKPDPARVERYRNVLLARRLEGAAYEDPDEEVKQRLKGWGYM
ncbi:MAG TPA: sulfatase-like hydrolase/transferase [bacterium]|nr:sulfatase-like hydrolase/transferase [bacterium]